MEGGTPTIIIDTQGAASVSHGGGATPIQISIVNQGDVTNIIDSSGNTLSSREDDVIAVLGQLFESADETLHQMAQQMIVKQAEPTPPPLLVPTDTLVAETLVESYQHRPFVCHCGKTYKAKSHLKYHQKVHNNARTYVCKWCQQSFLQLGHLKRHERIHTLVKPFSCDVCRKSFRQKGHLICHKLIHTDEKPYKCEICGMAFRQRSAIFRHKTRRHSFDRHYVCSVCSRGYSGPSDLRRHEKTHINIIYFAVLNLKTNTSKICGHIQDDFSFDDLHVPPEPKLQEDLSENKLDRPDVTNTWNIPGIPNKPDTVPKPPRPFSCDICGKTYKNKGHLVFHSKVHLEDRPYKCLYCNKGFVQKGHLQRHVMVHTKEKPYICQVCKKVFRQSSHLNDHIKIHEDSRPNVCHVCTKGFRQTSALKRHMIRMHSSLEAFTCDACEKSYRLEADLKRHQLTSCGRTPKPRSKQPTNGTDGGREKNGAGLKKTPKRRPCRFNCEVCSKPFRSRSEIKVHMRTHTDERPFECGICGKIFKLLPHLKDHMLIHTGEKPYTCNVCKHTFRRDSALKRHILRMHSVTKSHTCEICGRAYFSAVDLRRHVKRHLGESSAQQQKKEEVAKKMLKKLKKEKKKKKKDKEKKLAKRHLEGDENKEETVQDQCLEHMELGEVSTEVRELHQSEMQDLYDKSTDFEIQQGSLTSDGLVEIGEMDVAEAIN